MRKSQFVALGLVALCTSGSVHGLERTAMNRLLELARPRNVQN
jgi:hypothetical protein